MSRIVAAFLSGLVFGAGLLISQMSNPAKVIGFLDLTGSWDPSLAFVMAGAVAVFGAAYWRARRRRAPLLAPRFATPSLTDIDLPLVAGSLIFGVGWGLSGFCPGPAVVSSAFGDWRVWLFVAAVIAGILLCRFRPGRQAVPREVYRCERSHTRRGRRSGWRPERLRAAQDSPSRCQMVVVGPAWLSV